MHMRHTKLLNLVNREKRISVAALARELGVSEVTIRKDLTILRGCSGGNMAMRS